MIYTCRKCGHFYNAEVLAKCPTCGEPNPLKKVEESS